MEKVVDTQLTVALSKHEERLVAVEQSSMKSIQNLDGLVDDIAKRHGFEFAERDQRIRDLERLNLKLISASETMVRMTKQALDGPNSSLAKIQKDVFALLKTSSKSFDSLSKALSLSISSILDGFAKLKLDEAVPRSKGGEEAEANKEKPSAEVTKPENHIDLENTPPTEATAEEKKEQTPPAASKDKNIVAGKGTVEKTPPKKTTDPTKPGLSSPKSDDDDSFSGKTTKKKR